MKTNNGEAIENLFAGKTALILGSLLVIGFAIFAALAAHDKGRRTTLERIDQPSAVGDPVVYTLPEGAPAVPPPTPVQVAICGGIPLFAGEIKGERDAEMMKAGKDDSGKMPLYRFRNKSGKLDEALWVKIATDKFLKLKPRE